VEMAPLRHHRGWGYDHFHSQQLRFSLPCTEYRTTA